MELKLSPIKTDGNSHSLVIKLDDEGVARWKEMRMTSMIYDVFMDEDRFEGMSDGTTSTDNTAAL